MANPQAIDENLYRLRVQTGLLMSDSCGGPVKGHPRTPMDKFFAALGLLICAGLALRMAVGAARRQRFDDACRSHWRNLVARARAVRSSAAAPKPKPADPKTAQVEAQRLIERARQRRLEVDQEGNVIRPRAFDAAKKKPPLH